MNRSALLLLCISTATLHADGPLDNIPEKVRRVPPPGLAIEEKFRAALSAGVEELARELAALTPLLDKKPALAELLPDVEIFHNAVAYALKYDEFYKLTDISTAGKLLAQGMERARQLRDGKPAWTSATGLVVRGYRSRIDGSVQPYGLVVPPSYRHGTATRHRLDLWFHGRGEKLTELSFLEGRLTSPGEFTPRDAFVLHPYGRYCNANHFAGEVDTFEALAHAQKHYAIDEDRIVARGFSMGGAACWHFAVHHAWRWAAAAPGAGFSETPDFLRVFQKETINAPWYEEKLWTWYDCNRWALNLYHCPTVAYSGEKDAQKQAADIMAAALDAEGIHLVHLIGPETGHGYHPKTKAELNRRIDTIVARGRERMPRKVRFVTYTLRYPRMHWVHVEGLEEHWKDARVEAEIVGDAEVKVTTRNVSALKLEMEPGWCPLDPTRPVTLLIDGVKVVAARPMSDRSWSVSLTRGAKGWQAIESFAALKAPRKRPGLQGPLDDAFMDAFLMVRPTGKPVNDVVGKWVEGEMAHALDHWRRQFRGELTARDDTKISDADVAGSNLILWGDPSSNAVLARIADKLPIRWSADAVTVGKVTYPSAHHVPVLIAPNPLNPEKYVVLNSGFTFREYDYLNNARQVPKLPDWTVLDIRQPPTSRAPAHVVDAGFFEEDWTVRERK